MLLCTTTTGCFFPLPPAACGKRASPTSPRLSFLSLFFGQLDHGFLLAHILPGVRRSRKAERFRFCPLLCRESWLAALLIGRPQSIRLPEARNPPPARAHKQNRPRQGTPSMTTS